MKLDKNPNISSSTQYRPDVDGLRAIAVLAVILYHANLALFSGGYIGVDIFFVISGYLITSITVNELNKDKFTFINFYIRRVKRLFPALFTLIVATFIFGYFYLLPDNYKTLGFSSMFTVFYLSNIYFMRLKGGYFAPGVDSLPLIHTWSLGVEEQYYLFYPAFLVIIKKWLKKRYVLWVSIALVASFILNIYLVKVDPEADFYLFFTRIWEFAFGGLLALGAFPKLNSNIVGKVLAWVGLVCILIAVFLYKKTTPFPGYAALLPTIGTLLVIYANTFSNNCLKKLLSTKGFVFIGLLSYSLYLWHWPILSAYRYFAPVLPQSTDDILLIVALLLTFILSYLSYRFIETPVRMKDFKSNPKKLFIPIFVIMIAIASFGYYLEYNDGLPNRYPKELQKIINAPVDKNLEDSKYMDLKPNEVSWDKYPTLGDKSATHYTFVVMGDSHADALSPGFDELAKKLHIKGKLLAASGNPPLFGVNWGDDDTLSQVKARYLDLIKEHPHIKKVFLVARWGIYANGHGYIYKDGKFVENPEEFLVLWDKDSKTHNNIAHNKEVLERGLVRTLKIFNDMHIQVYVVFDVPEIGWNVPETLSKLYILRNIQTKKIKVPTYADYLQRQKPVFEAFKEAEKHYKFTLINPAKYMCIDNKTCVILDKDGYPLYLDTNHLTNHGAYYVVNHDPKFKEYLKTL